MSDATDPRRVHLRIESRPAGWSIEAGGCVVVTPVRDAWLSGPYDMAERVAVERAMTQATFTIGEARALARALLTAAHTAEALDAAEMQR